MRNCAKCMFSLKEDGGWICRLGSQTIPHPYVMGGPKRCQCYEDIDKKERKVFIYPLRKEWYPVIKDERMVKTWEKTKK